MADGDLSAAVRRADPDRWLASRFIADKAARAEVIALYALEGELDRAARIASPPAAQLRLTWWRDAIADLLAGGVAPAHPVLATLAKVAARRRLPAAPFEVMIEARIAALECPIADAPGAAAFADEVGGSAAVLACHILDPASPEAPARAAGRVWALLEMRRTGALPSVLIDPPLTQALAAARSSPCQVSPGAFPAIAAAAMAGPELAGRTAGPLETRLRLILAVARGRL